MKVEIAELQTTECDIYGEYDEKIRISTLR